MGMGFSYVVPADTADKVVAMVPGAKVVGEVIEKPGAWLGDMQVT
jgi:phosphoribosylformylglycinamidine cyclo-ligase